MTFSRAGWLISGGALCWALHFAAIYGFTGIACARGMASVVPWAIATLTFLAACAAIAIIVLALRHRDSFEHRLAAGVAGFALVDIVWEALPSLLVSACA
jgi:hypothetical protein